MGVSKNGEANEKKSKQGRRENMNTGQRKKKREDEHQLPSTYNTKKYAVFKRDDDDDGTGGGLDGSMRRPLRPHSNGSGESYLIIPPLGLPSWTPTRSTR